MPIIRTWHASLFANRVLIVADAAFVTLRAWIYARATIWVRSSFGSWIDRTVAVGPSSAGRARPRARFRFELPGRAGSARISVCTRVTRITLTPHKSRSARVNVEVPIDRSIALTHCEYHLRHFRPRYMRLFDLIFVVHGARPISCRWADPGTHFPDTFGAWASRREQVTSCEPTTGRTSRNNANLARETVPSGIETAALCH